MQLNSLRRSSYGFPIQALSAAILYFAAALPLSADIFLKAGAPAGGDGASWSAAFNTLEDAVQAVSSSSQDAETLYVAGGICPPPTTSSGHTVSRDLTIRGGYLGAVDGGMTRDSEECQTVISGINSPASVYWKRVRPVPGTFTLVGENTGQAIVVDGKLNLPTPSTQYETFRSPSSSRCCFTVAAGAGLTADGIKFICFTRQSNPGGSAIGFQPDASRALVTSCVFAGGGTLQRAMLYLSSTAAPPLISNCGFYYNQATCSSAPHAVVSASTVIENCRFMGALVNSSAPASCALAGNATVRSSLFAHSIAVGSASASGCPIVDIGAGTLDGCVIRDNFAASQKIAGAYQPASVVRISAGKAVNCLIAGNRSEFSVIDGRVYTMLGRNCGTSGGPCNVTCENCLIASSTVVAARINMTSGSYALGIMGSGSTARSYTDTITGCQIEGNSAICVEVDGVTPVLSSGIIAARMGSAQSMTVANCTFKAPYAENVHAVAQYGTTGTAKSTFRNSVFMCDGADVYDNVFYSAQPDLLIFSNTTVKNYAEHYYVPGIDVTAGLQTDEVPFVRDPYLFNSEPTGYAWLVPSAKTPGIADTDNGTIRGAVNDLTPEAREGFTLTIRRSPVNGGYVDIPAQAVYAGSAISPVTATPAPGASFSGWFDGESLFSSSNPLVIESLGSDKVLTASFSTRKTLVSFDLGGAGLFTANGASVISFSLSAGEPFPAIPPYSLNDNVHIYEWDDMPAAVSENDTVYSARWVTKDVRTVYVAPGGAGDGSSWGSPLGDLAAACADAGRYRGEVWMREGVYELALPVARQTNIVVRGGFAGNETTASQADPKSHPTVISGGGTTYYAFYDSAAIQGETGFSGLTFRDFARGAIDFAVGDVGQVTLSECIFENCNTSKDSAYAPVKISGSAVVTDSLFTNCYNSLYITSSFGVTSLVERCEFNAVTGTTMRVVLLGGASFVARDSSRMGGAGPGFNISGGDNTDHAVLVERCRFTGGFNQDIDQGAVYLYSGAAMNTKIRECSFEGNSYENLTTNSRKEYNKSETAACLTANVKNGIVTVLNSSFIGNSAVGRAGSSKNASCVALQGAAAYVFENCTFEGNTATAVTNVTLDAVHQPAGKVATFGVWSSNGKALIANCLFNDNTVVSATDDYAADIFNDSTVNTMYTIIINSVLWNESDGYVPLQTGLASVTKQGRNVMRAFNASAIRSSDYTEFGPVWTSDPKLIGSLRRNANSVAVRGISSVSPYRNSGYPLWTFNGGLYIYNADTEDSAARWPNLAHCIFTKAWNPPAGLTLDTPCDPDFFGAPRRLNSVALGPLNIDQGTYFFIH